MASTTCADMHHTEPAERKHLWRKIGLGFAIILIAALIGARLYLPVWATDYVNRTLENIPGYTGSISDVDIHLYRGAYTIHDLKLFKKTRGIPVPFLDFKSSDLSIQWAALFDGRVVGDVTLYSPTINFATGKTGATQTGVETDWTKPIKDLMPLDINFVEIHDGKIAYKDFSTKPEVDLSIYNMEARVTNLRNVEKANAALPSTLTATGTSIGKGKLDVTGKMNILKRIPDFALKSKLESINLPAINSYARAFAGIDFNTGNLNIYSDLTVKDGLVSGYVKPLATDIDLIGKKEEGISVLWESVVSVVMEIFTNQREDQFATQIELEGNLNDPDTNFWSTLGGIFKNAFVKAFSNSIEKE
ncbi:MAG TPA: DUF748 domain-containing protein [Micavibrio sp.]|nr:DUF748 domain-containing protein [Micavibrio sp.]